MKYEFQVLGLYTAELRIQQTKLQGWRWFQCLQGHLRWYKLDAQISADRLEAESARYELMAHVDARALEISELWIELEKYEALNGLISSRLEVLDPLISQLEEVAKAGIGDVSSVAAAQRTVSNIRVAQTNVSEKLEQARLNFLNGFGDLPQGVFYDADLIKRSLPNTITEDLVYKSPAPAVYEMYKQNLRGGGGLSQEQFQVGFEARASRPFGGRLFLG